MKKYINHILWLWAVLLVSVSCSEDEQTAVTPGSVDEPQVTTLNVDVVLPDDIRQQWQHTIDMAQDNIARAQQRLSRQVKLNLRYHDEDKENIDALAYKLTHPENSADSCHAIIGPYHSSHAMSILQYAWKERLPVVMPSCTSAELQRINARATYAWFLTESDITQCEVMIATARIVGYKEVMLVYSDDNYGKSFLDWFSYYATEQGLKTAGAVAYAKGKDLIPFFTTAAKASTEKEILVLVALNDASGYLDVCEQTIDFYDTNANGDDVKLSTICADTSYSDEVIDAGQRSSFFQMGITPYCAPTMGFAQCLYAAEKRNPLVGEAQMYDALTMIALGAAHQKANGERCLVNGKQVAYAEKPFGPVLTDHMRALVSQQDATATDWTPSGLTVAFTQLQNGHDIRISGASGALVFDKETSTKVLNSTYLVWQLYNDVKKGNTTVEPMLYLSTRGSNTEASTTLLWEHNKSVQQQFDDTPVSVTLPAVTDHWAVVISPSTSWANYRHQADAFAMYQTLRHHGYDDDHIVLIVEDNLANDERNLFPGEIFVERNSNPKESDPLVNDNVRKNAVVDYHFSQLKPDDLAAIMLGRQSASLPHVIHPTSTSDVFFFWSGHGGYGEGPLWGNEDNGDAFGTKRFKDFVTKMSDEKMFRRMMFCIETCYSGLWGQAVIGIPNVLVMTAATDMESSKADAHSSELGVFLSNAFSRTFRRQVYNKNDITIYNLYRELFRTTTGSHVSIYNQKNYGSVYTETMVDYLPE